MSEKRDAAQLPTRRSNSSSLWLIRPTDYYETVFHPDAAARFNEIGRRLRDRVRVTKATRTGPTTRYEPYPAANIKKEDLIGKVTWTKHIVDGLGREQGRLWTLRGETVGLVGEGYEELKKLAETLAKTPALRGRVNVPFLIEEIWRWLQGALDGTAVDDLSAYVTGRCGEVIKEYEIWVPLFRVHASEPISMGDVLFQKIAPEMMDVFFANAPTPLPEAARTRVERLRSELQNHLAACIKVIAEKNTAQTTARSKAEAAIAFLRFLSPSNWILDFQSYCLALGRERIEIPTELFVADGKIRQVSREPIEHGPVLWDIDPDRARFPGVLEMLHSLALDHSSSDFRRHLYDALLLYSRNSIAAEPTDKLIFVVVSLESMLLKDGNEPITKNIGERMAFLIGNSIEERKAVIQNVDSAYRLRSKFVHHGQSAEESEVVEQFCAYAWQSFHVLLGHLDTYTTKAALIEALENRKLS